MSDDPIQEAYDQVKASILQAMKDADAYWSKVSKLPYDEQRVHQSLAYFRSMGLHKVTPEDLKDPRVEFNRSGVLVDTTWLDEMRARQGLEPVQLAPLVITLTSSKGS